MKKLKKGLRLNDENRKEIIELIIINVMGSELAELELSREEVTLKFSDAAWADLGGASVPEELPKGATPELSQILVRSGMTQWNEPKFHRVDLSRKVQVPYSMIHERTTAQYLMAVDSATREALTAFTEKAVELKSKELSKRDKLLTHLRGFTSPQKLLDSNPEFEEFLPESMWDEVQTDDNTPSLSELIGDAA